MAFFLVEGGGPTHLGFGQIYTTQNDEKANGETKKPTREHAGGITYIPHEVPEAPWSIHAVKIARSRDDLQFEYDGQNFYMYLDPRSNKIGFFPWGAQLRVGYDLPIAAESLYRLDKFDQTVGLKSVAPAKGWDVVDFPTYDLKQFIAGRGRSVRQPTGWRVARHSLEAP